MAGEAPGAQARRPRCRNGPPEVLAVLVVLLSFRLVPKRQQTQHDLALVAPHIVRRSPGDDDGTTATDRREAFVLAPRGRPVDPEGPRQRGAVEGEEAREDAVAVPVAAAAVVPDGEEGPV